MSIIVENEFKTTKLKKSSWKYLKKKSNDKKTPIIEELDSLIKKGDKYMNLVKTIYTELIIDKTNDFLEERSLETKEDIIIKEEDINKRAILIKKKNIKSSDLLIIKKIL